MTTTGGVRVEEKVKKINELFVDTYNSVCKVEETAIRQGLFRDLSLKEIHTIKEIGKYGSRIMTDLAHTMKVTMGTLTVTVDKLIRKGYLERQRSDEDRRIVRVILTKQGKLAYRLHEKFHYDMVKASLNQFSEEEEQVLVSALNKLNQFLKKMEYPMTHCNIKKN